jgi:hypothetical protein
MEVLTKLSNLIDRIAATPGAVIDFFTDPFWAVAGGVVGVVLLCMIIAYFFSSGRALAGAVAISSILFAVGFRKGQSAEDERKAAEIAKLKARLENQPREKQWWER